MKEAEVEEFCPNCKKDGINERLLIIPPRDGRKQHLCCTQCNKKYPCNNNGKRTGEGLYVERLC